MIDWKKYIDHIYIVDYVYTDKDINSYFNDELKRVGIDRYDTSFVTTFENISAPLYQILYNSFTNQTFNDDYQYNYAYDVTIAHYYCMKLAQAKNQNRILILENDCIFYDDVNVIDNILNQVKNGFDNNEIDLFCGNLSVSYDNVVVMNYSDTNIYKYSNYDLFCAGAAFNIYNSNAYNVFINYIENEFYSVVDQYYIIYYKKNINIWYSHIMLCVQKNWDTMMYNLYEHYNMLIPPVKEKVYEIYNNFFNEHLIYEDHRNQIKILVDCLEHFNLENTYNDIYTNCKNFLNKPNCNEIYLP